jgi:EAL domain-containing protein (putative c-di-GMP-specific phosphodiesterase class I)
VAAPRSTQRSGAGRLAATRRVAGIVQSGVDVALQPIVDLDSGEVVAVEALARFPDGRSPDKWFAEADSLGLGTALELAAIESALTRMSEIPARAALNVNVSAATASSAGLVERLASAPAGRIVLEITEHVPVEDYKALESALAGLRARGVRLAIDDAGAGFASMQHVLRLRPDVVKLDASLVRGIDSEPDRQALISALVSFAAATGCSLIAEGVETAAELDAARELGVACAQGFHLGRPDTAGPSRWQVDLPRKTRRLKASSRGPGRFLRPATIFLAAALSAQGLVAMAGVAPRRAADTAPRTSAAAAPASDTPDGSSPAERPAAAADQHSNPEAARKAEAISSSQPSPSRAAPPSEAKTTGPAGPVAGVVETVGDVTTGLTETVSGVTETVTHTLDGLLRGVLGGR